MSQPRVPVSPTPLDKVLDRTALLLLLALWGLSILAYTRLPETIPIHFDGAGQPNGYGGKAALFILPAIGSLLFLLLGALNTSPHIFNYPVSITPENAASQYTRATRFMRWLRLCLLLTFSIVVVYTWAAASEKQTRYGAWLIAAILSLSLAPVLIYIVSALRRDK